MKYFFVAMASVAVVVLVGCAAAPAPTPAATPAVAPAPPPAPIARCNADGARFVVGQTHSASLEAAAQYRSASASVRVRKPGTMATAEVDASRLTIDVDARGRVTAARCG